MAWNHFRHITNYKIDHHISRDQLCLKNFQIGASKLGILAPTSLRELKSTLPFRGILKYQPSAKQMTQLKYLPTYVVDL